MGNDYSTTIITIINLILLLTILFIIYIGLKSFKNFLQKNKDMELKIDTIFNKLEDK